MAELLPKLPEGVRRADLGDVHIMAMEYVEGELVGGVREFEGSNVAGYNVWIQHITSTEWKSLAELDRDFLASDYGSRELALAAARAYTWQIAAKYQLEVEEY